MKNSFSEILMIVIGIAIIPFYVIFWIVYSLLQGMWLIIKPIRKNA